MQEYDAIPFPQLGEMIPIYEYNSMQQPLPKRKRKSFPIGGLSLACYKPKKNATHPFNILQYPPKRKK